MLLGERSKGERTKTGGWKENWEDGWLGLRGFDRMAWRAECW